MDDIFNSLVNEETEKSRSNYDPIMAELLNEAKGSTQFHGKASEFREKTYGERSDKQYFRDKAKAGFLGVGDIATMGYLDELTGAAMSMHPDITYQQGTKATRDLMDKSRERDPAAFMAGGAYGGGLIGGAYAPKTLKGLLGAAGAEGFAYGSGSADEGNRISGGLGGAGTAAAISAVFPALGFGWNTAKKLVNPQVANRQLKTIIDATGKTPKQLQEVANKYDPRYTSLMNTSEDTIAASARGVSQQDPMARQIIRQNVKGQVGGAKNRINQQLDTLSGMPRNYWKSYDKLKNIQKGNAAKNYPKAMQGDVLPTDEMLEIMQNPLTAKAWKEASDQAAAEGRKLPKLYDYDDLGNAVFTGENWPNMKDIQSIKFGLDDTIKAYGKQAKMGSSASAPGKYRNANIVKNRFMKEVGKQNPDFIQANKVFAGDATTRSALEKGRKAATTNINDRMKDINAMNQSEKDAYLQGVLSDFNHRLGTSPKDKSASINFMQNENMEKTIHKLLPKKKASALYNRLDAEVRYKENAQIATGGSQTADNIDMGGKMSSGAMDALNMVTAPKAAIPMQVYKWLSESKVKPEVWQDLAQVLTKQGGVEEALKRAAAAGVSQAQIDTMRRSAAQYGLMGTTALLPGLLSE